MDIIFFLRRSYADRLKGYFALLRHRYDIVIELHTDALSRKPKTVSCYLYRGVAYVRTLQFFAAIPDNIDAITLIGTHPNRVQTAVLRVCYVNRAVARIAIGNNTGALEDVNTAFQLISNKNSRLAAVLYLTRSVLYISREDYVAALNDLDKAEILYGIFPRKRRLIELYSRRAIIHHKLNQPQVALADCEKMVRLSRGQRPELQVIAYGGRAHAYQLNGDSARADQDLDSMFRIAAYDKHSQRSLLQAQTAHASVLALRGDHRGAIEGYTKALQFSPEGSALYHARATSYQALGNESAAQADFHKVMALSLEPPLLLPRSYQLPAPQPDTISSFMIGLIIFYFVIVFALVSLIDSNPSCLCDDLDTLVRTGTAQYHAGHYQQAIAAFDSAIALNPGDATLYYDRAISWYKLNRWFQAVDDCKQAVRLDTDDTLTQNALTFCQALIKGQEPPL